MNFQNRINHAFQQFESGNLEETNQIYPALFQGNLTTEQEVQIRFLYGYLLVDQNQLEEALDNYNRVLKLAHALEDNGLITQSHHQIGMVYRVGKQYHQAVLQFQKERAYIDKYFADHSLFLAANDYEMGYTNLLNGHLEQSKLYLEQSLKYALESEDDVMMACSYRGLGDYYKENRSLDLAKDMYNKSIKHFKRADDGLGVQEVEEKLHNLK